NFMPHCLFENKGVIDKENNKYTLFLHTDFNNERIVPKTIDEAMNMISKAKSKRAEYLMKLTERLGFRGEVVNDFTHNTVRIEGDSVIYAKGCINVNDSGQSGVLLVNPVIGLVYYTSDFKKTSRFMQHGISMLKKQNYYNEIPKLSNKKVRGYLVYRLLENTRKKCLNECEDDLHYFNEKFQSGFERMKYVQPHFIVRTKG
ncbi:MAG: hypothetical protein SVK54_00665, partial [candidate division WOR-3 bacterium]|nr:hypothetical protein [candidate division WOR-3 bacterium]